MTINKNSWMVWLIKSTFSKRDDALPKSLCTFFWAFMSALILLPFTWFAQIYNLLVDRKEPEYGVPVMFPIILSVLIAMSGTAICFGTHSWYGSELTWEHFFSAYWVGFVVVAILVLILVGLVYAGVFIRWIYRQLPKKARELKVYKEPKQHLVWEFIKAKKQKVCPLITYKED